MKITENWLQEHLQSTADLQSLTAKLTAIGLEVEAVDDLGEALKPFIIAEVIEAKPHPNADKLQVCLVNIGGGKKLEVVCGAPNARTGMKGVFAPVGSYVPGIDLTLKAGEIRGVVSNGMLCSERELLLSDEHDGIIDLPADAPVGTSYAEWAGLNEAVIDINITPNRGDCLGVRGIARDLAAAGLGTLKPLQIKDIKSEFAPKIKWQIDKNLPQDACPFVMGRSFMNVKNGSSPDWMQKRLKAIGLRPISALVDITNYVTFDLGRPLHVFDADKIQGDVLTMRSAKSGEEILALDGKTYKLQDGMTVISDAKSVCGIGGIMGGEHSGCDETTTHVFLEAALFSASRTATTGRALSIESDARYRFERGIDPAFVTDGVAIASQLITEICGGIAGEIVQDGKIPNTNRSITLNYDRIKTFAGTEIPEQQALEILQNLGFDAKADGKKITATIPSWRPDIEGEHCLIEEILRIYGFDNIKAVSLPKPAEAVSPTNEQQNRQQAAALALANRGFYEVISWSFTSDEQAKLFAIKDTESVKIANPIASNLTIMRPSILANLTTLAAKNRDRGYNDLALFEIGPVFYGSNPDEQFANIAGIRIGNIASLNWHEKPRLADLYDAKADVLAVLQMMQAPTDNLKVWTEDLPAYYHPGKAAALNLGKQSLAVFGQLHPKHTQALDLPESTVIFEIYPNNLPPLKQGKARPAFKPSQLQAVWRDFAFVVDKTTPADNILTAIKSADKKLISQVNLFDVYEGEALGDKKSLAIRVALQSYDKTLEEADIEAVSQAIIQSVEKKTGAVLRQ